MDSKSRLPQQKRGLETRRRLMEAAFQEFSEHGYHGTNSKAIAATAQVAVGSFYAYFPDKKQLFLEVLKEYCREIGDRVSAATQIPVVGNLNATAIIRRIIENVIQAHERHDNFEREIEVMRLSDPEVQEIYAEEELKAWRMTLAMFESGRAFFRVEDLETAAFIIYQFMEAMRPIILQGDPPVDKNRIIQEMAEMLARYLLKNS